MISLVLAGCQSINTESLLEAEVIHRTKRYQEDLTQYFGLSMSPQKVTEEESLITDLTTELELLDDIESLADEDADAIDELD
jgi:hypothetical protein